MDEITSGNVPSTSQRNVEEPELCQLPDWDVNPHSQGKTAC